MSPPALRLAAFNPAVKTLDESVARAVIAERLGLESVWASQLPDARDTALVLAAYARATERIGFGTGVLPIYTRHPTAMVQMAATLDELSGGRFILGIGISHKVTVESMWGMRLESPVDAMREYLDIVRTSLRDGGCSVDGKYFSAHWAYSGPRRAEMPVMISALNPRMLELAGELADGVVLWMCSPAYVRDHVIPAVRAARPKVGKTMDGFEVIAAVPACLTTDRAAALEVFRQTVERYANVPYYRKMMDNSGFKAQLAEGVISEEMMDELAGIGDENQIRDAIRRYREAGVTLPAAGPFSGHKGGAGFEKTLEAAADC
ncbi:MAG: TIGR03564 family F420-dependent LLM class oxidoreductase [Candidatus Dormibacteraceae bacterium]